ncbi:MAG: hypothetical protein ACLTPN_00835 [Clostridia bacterium]
MENKIESVDFVETKNTKKKFQAKCFKCKEKEKMTTDKGVEFELPFKYVDVPKNKDLMKECKQYVKESKEKYGNDNVIKRALLNYCPNCGNTINLSCKDYVDFYAPKKKEEKVEK